MESLARTTQNAGATLETSSATLTDARDVLAATSDTAVALSGALDISILGSQPFAGASERLAELARTITTFQGKAQALALNLNQNATDVGLMTDRIRDLKDQVNELAARVADFDRIGEIVNLVLGGIVLVGLLTAWIAVGAAFCAWAGWKVRRAGATDGSATQAPDGPEPASA
jgi:methyl-accepting chemotaxis protein